VLAGAAAGVLFGRKLHRLRLLFQLADALGLGAYAVVGAQKALAAGLSLFAVAFVGTLNAVGGGVARDVLVHEVPLVFKPGEWYALAALIGCLAFLALSAGLGLPRSVAAVAGIAVAFAARMLSLRLGWRTGSLAGDEPWEAADRGPR